ncbi:hypothetical protein WMF45_08670 [Sorangium sp. So ce448]|uniref:hypothetical protein n=1 Tax=Sorangium sp. So ce448 TaxID=3133314 RepID=UPI003F63D520
MRTPFLLLVGSLFLPGCPGDPTVIGPCQPQEYGNPGCPWPEQGGGGAGGEGGGGGAGGSGGTGGGDETACAGDCVPPAPLGWFGPALLWFGPRDQVPDCPADAPNVGYEGFADLAPAPLACAACLCDPPEAAAASCQLPLGWSAHTSTTCSGDPGSVATAFAAPGGWDGACTAANAIPAGQNCGGQPCVKSISIDAPAVLVTATATCTPRVDEPPPPALLDPWLTRALACVPGAYTECLGDRSTCMPSPEQPGVPPPGGFLTCIFHEGDVTCEEPYLDRHVFYGGAEDRRGCSECGCGELEGASCTIMASVYSDGACAEQVASTLVSSRAPFCGVTPPGIALGSKSAEVVAVDPGGCAPSGGEPTGELLPAEPSTFCCQA